MKLTHSESMNYEKRIELLGRLGDWLLDALEASDPSLEAVIEQAFFENKWFTADNQKAALRAIAVEFLDREKLQNWSSKRPGLARNGFSEKSVGIVMAGNLPLVGFHDWLSVFVAGHRALVKLSEKDRLLLPFLLQKMGELGGFEALAETVFVDRLTGFDAVIATGSNNARRYFEQYFSKKPNVLRGSRHSVAVLDGSETFADLLALGSDIFSFFGLGCRNVSMILVPRGYDFDQFMEATHEFRELANHDKWRNNFDYNTTLFLLNKIKFLQNGCLLLREDPTIEARIACCHADFYADEADLAEKLARLGDQIQCVVSKKPLAGRPFLPFGKAQSPRLEDWADGSDVLAFLSKNLAAQV